MVSTNSLLPRQTAITSASAIVNTQHSHGTYTSFRFHFTNLGERLDNTKFCHISTSMNIHTRFGSTGIFLSKRKLSGCCRSFAATQTSQCSRTTRGIAFLRKLRNVADWNLIPLPSSRHKWSNIVVKATRRIMDWQKPVFYSGGTMQPSVALTKPGGLKFRGTVSEIN